MMFTPSISPANPNLLLLNCNMSGAYRSTDGGDNWEIIHYRQLTSSTRVRPAWHPVDANIAFATEDRGGSLKITRDRGVTWIAIPGAPSAVCAIGIDPGHPDLMLVGGRRGIYRSADSGQHWAEVGTVRGKLLGFHFDQTSPVGKRTCFAATDQALLRSDDAGATWREIRAGLGSGSLLSFAGGSNKQSGDCVLYCSVESREAGGQITGGIYRSDDRGTTWIRAMGVGIAVKDTPWGSHPAQPSQYAFILTTDVNPSRVYAAREWAGKVFRSDNRGVAWCEVLLHQDMKSPRFNIGPDYLIDERGVGGQSLSGFGINPANPDHLIVTGWMNCFITKNGGKAWVTANTCSAEPPGRRGKGMRWLNNGLVVTSVWHYYLDPFEPNRHYIAYTDLGYARSIDAGQSWYWQTGLPLRNTTYEMAFDPTTRGKIWAAFADLHDIPNGNIIFGAHYDPHASGGLGVSADFGVTWQDTSHGLPPKPITSVVVDPKSPQDNRTLYISAFEDGVYKSTNGGQSWVKKSSGLGAPSINMRTCRIILHPDGTLFCLVTALREEDGRGQFLAHGPGLYRSRDGGESWQWINRSQPLLWPKDYDVDPRDSRIVYLGASDANNAEGGLYKTTNDGANWTRIARKGSQCFGATINPHKPDWVYLCITESAPEAGLWLSKDAGKTWTALDGMPFRNVQRVSFDPQDDSIIYVSTFGGSVWKGPAEQ